MLFADHDKLLMIGDSITDCGRARPVGEGVYEALGKGYVSLIEALIGATYPERTIRIANMGTSGDTVRHLKERWETDVLALKPHWLSILIGINDVWRQFDNPAMKEWHVYIDEYETTLHELVEKTRPLVKGLVIMSPFYLESNESDPMRATMDLYGQAAKRIAESHDCIFVDLQAAFDHMLKHVYPATLTWDRVHPNAPGQMVIARAFLNAVGYEWDRSAD
ncbi:SGNH/GDSL hydrolase family protein [Gorillibacterium sp. CAU 1737]|uniref:SGNH/GDSL hydrolase family protein n=1 Tax=Gorillibacterium sp. CAU 1737 TaxID=3140362 RepID=UPI00326004E2